MHKKSISKGKSEYGIEYTPIYSMAHFFHDLRNDKSYAESHNLFQQKV